MQIWAYFSGQVGCKLNWPLPHRKSAVIFREYFALNPCSLYPGSCSFGLWLPSTPQFGEFRISLLIATFVLLSMLSFFELCLFCILRHLNDNRAYLPQRRGFGGLGLRWHKRTFFDMPSSHGVGISPPPSLVHSRCFDSDTKGADGAADLLEVLRNSPLQKLNFYCCSQIPSTAWQKLRGASWSNLREANFGWCLVLQTSLRCLASSDRRCVFFSRMLRAIVTAVSLTTFGNIERPKM